MTACQPNWSGHGKGKAEATWRWRNTVNVCDACKEVGIDTYKDAPGNYVALTSASSGAYYPPTTCQKRNSMHTPICSKPATHHAAGQDLCEEHYNEYKSPPPTFDDGIAEAELQNIGASGCDCANKSCTWTGSFHCMKVR